MLIPYAMSVNLVLPDYLVSDSIPQKNPSFHSSLRLSSLGFVGSIGYPYLFETTQRIFMRLFLIQEGDLYEYNIHIIVEEHFNICSAPVRSRGGSLVNNKTCNILITIDLNHLEAQR
jgi:hypothetical protein